MAAGREPQRSIDPLPALKTIELIPHLVRAVQEQQAEIVGFARSGFARPFIFVWGKGTCIYRAPDARRRQSRRRRGRAGGILTSNSALENSCESQMGKLGMSHTISAPLPWGRATLIRWALRPQNRLLVFVHGFLGSAAKTWGYLPDQLTRDDRFAGFDLLFFDYKTMERQTDYHAEKLG